MAEVSQSPESIQPHLQSLLRTSAKRTRDLFAADFSSPSTLSALPAVPYSIAPPLNPPQEVAERASLATRIHTEYRTLKDLPPALEAKQASATAATAAARRAKKAKVAAEGNQASDTKVARLIDGINESSRTSSSTQQSQALVLNRKNPNSLPPNANGPTVNRNLPSSALVRKDTVRQIKPEWHAPWKLMRVISGHLGWVRSLAVEPGNQWFASGAGDRTIKIWDLVSGTLKLTLTGHISTVRGLAVSPRHPYLFSCGEDKMVKCWDLETNKVIRHYHGHLSGVYTMDIHPTLDVLVTGGRDGVARVWDMRTRSNIHVLSGHKGTVADVKCQEADPQVISASLDSTVRLWDLAAGKTMGVLTHHKKGVRTLATHPNEFTFASGSTNSIKQWKCPEAAFMQNFDGHNSIVNTLSVNAENVMFSGGDDGSMYFWDWKTGHSFQNTASMAQPGSLDAEQGIFTSTFDQTGLRLITGEADKTIKVWKPDDEATEQSHPLDWKPTLGRQKF
ncbi:WD40 repeat-like protein [Microthyrium microscopicum]|uniref:Pre-mRNA-splicing factor PRP46 n=1 Tax=Microthyrium microscopicum TaxID=703497 RepID=A0A6A6U5K3_9PEZI|nr:WD40 repeat-like protein [Microthyrium microscopicum]